MPEAAVASPLGLCVAFPSLPIPDDLEDRKKEQIDEHGSDRGLSASPLVTPRPSPQPVMMPKKPRVRPPPGRHDPLRPRRAPVLFRVTLWANQGGPACGAVPLKLSSAAAARRELTDERRKSTSFWAAPSYLGDKFGLGQRLSRPGFSTATESACITTGDATLISTSASGGFAVAWPSGRRPRRSPRAGPNPGVDARWQPRSRQSRRCHRDLRHALQASAVVVAEFIAGRPVDLSSKHSRTDDKFQARPRPKLAPESPLRGPPAMRAGR
jgi:hypothetical protein